MNMTNRTDFLQKSFKDLYKLSYWTYSPEWKLIYSNSEHVSELNNFLLLSLSDLDREKIANADAEIINMMDFLGLVWIIIAKKDFYGNTINYEVLGPTFPTDISDDIIKNKMDLKGMSISSQIKLIRLLSDIPTIDQREFNHIGELLYYASYDKKPEKFLTYFVDDSEQAQAASTSTDKYSKVEEKYHGTYAYEQEMLRVVREGDISKSNMFAATGQNPERGEVGLMAPGNPIRQAKNSFIILSALVLRAAIEGGVPPESAYNLSDYYIQRIEAANTNAELYQIPHELFADFTNRVHSIKKENASSSVVNTAIFLLKNHIKEDGSIDAIAHELGLTTYYLTSLIKKETGKSFKQIVKEEKIALAKNLLRNSTMEISEISEELNFTSPSYFISIFKKETGKTPGEWRSK